MAAVKWIPKPIPGTAPIQRFFPPLRKTVAVSVLESSTSAEPPQPPQSTSQPAVIRVSVGPVSLTPAAAVVKTAVFKRQPRLRPGQIIKRGEDVTKLKNSVTTVTLRAR